jgi:hypothetical protein
MKLPVLTYKQVRAAAKRAYLASKLAAQDPVPEGRVCKYITRHGRHCAIGAGLPSQAIKAIKARQGFNCRAPQLGQRKIATWASFQDATQACTLQVLHDTWADRARFKGLLDEQAVYAEAEFAAALGIKQAAEYLRTHRHG